jgi:hypothetical protein
MNPYNDVVKLAPRGANLTITLNSAARSGMRSKEFGGSGYNQLLFDDTDQQGRTGLTSTQAATGLTLATYCTAPTMIAAVFAAGAPNCAPMPSAPCAPVPVCC